MINQVNTLLGKVLVSKPIFPFVDYSAKMDFEDELSSIGDLQFFDEISF